MDPVENEPVQSDPVASDPAPSPRKGGKAWWFLGAFVVGGMIVISLLAKGPEEERKRPFGKPVAPAPTRRPIKLPTRIARNTPAFQSTRTPADAMTPLEKVKATSDPDELAEIAATTKDRKVAIAAASKLPAEPVSQEKILLVSRESSAPYIRRMAVERLEDPETIKRIATEEEDAETCATAVARLTDQFLLGQIVKNDKRQRVRAAATGRITNPDTLNQLASKDEKEDVRLAALGQITDQTTLARIAINRGEMTRIREAAIQNLSDNKFLAMLATSGAEKDTIRKAALERLTDQDALTRIIRSDTKKDWRALAVGNLRDRALLEKLSKDKEFSIRKAALKRLGELAVEGIDDPVELEKIVNDRKLDGHMRQAATDKIVERLVTPETDPKALEEIAKNHRILAVQQAARRQPGTTLPGVARIVSSYGQNRAEALLETTNPHLLKALVEKGELSRDMRELEILLMTDREALEKLAADPKASMRKIAVLAIADDDYVASHIDSERSRTVREAMVRSLQRESSILQTAMTAYYADAREAAFKLLTRPDTIRRAEAARQGIADRVEELKFSKDFRELVREAIGGVLDVYRIQAATTLKDDGGLARVANEATDREVLKIVLAKISDKLVLADIAQGAKDRAMRLAAGQKAGTLTWEDIFKTPSSDIADTGALADAIAAASLYDKVQPRVRRDVEQTCLKLIRLGNESRIPEMVDLLNLYGNKTLCEDYLNCNQPDLYQAGVDWAHARGYSVGSGHGSSRAKWGSGR